MYLQVWLVIIIILKDAKMAKMAKMTKYSGVYFDIIYQTKEPSHSTHLN